MKILKLMSLCMVLIITSCRNNVLDVPVKSIVIEGANITDGGSSQLTAVISPEKASEKAVSWSVSDPGIATIDEVGMLTAVKDGQVVVTVAALDKSGVEGKKSFTISGISSGDPADDSNDDGSGDDSGDENVIDPNLGGIQVGTAAEIRAALTAAKAGDTIYVFGGDYVFTSIINITVSGSSDSKILLFAHPNSTARPKFDFSAQSESPSNRGINLKGSYWYVKGIDVFAAGDNGLNITGSNNLIEFCTFSENADTGLQIDGGAANNTILNCDSYYNADATKENADGFACKLDAGSGNKFIGCRAWQNLDDGWDGYLKNTDNITTTYENCWAFKNGYLKDGAVGAGDGNGFKTGGSDNKDLKHNAEYRNCVSAGNTHDGFDHNSNRGSVLMYNCSAHQNGRNISFSSTNIAASLTIKNSLSLLSSSSDSFNATTTDITNNSWLDGLSATTDDFESVDMYLLASPRKADGSLPDINYLKLKSGSDLIDKGIDVGLDYNGSAPDLGAFETE